MLDIYTNKKIRTILTVSFGSRIYLRNVSEKMVDILTYPSVLRSVEMVGWKWEYMQMQMWTQMEARGQKDTT